MKNCKLGEIIHIYDSLRKPVSGFARINKKGTYPYYGANGIIDYVNEHIFKGEFILFAEDGTVCSSDFKPVVFITHKNDEFWVNNHAHIFKANQKICSTKYLFYNLSTINIKHIITGAVQLKVNQENLKSLGINIHNFPEQQHIVNILGSIDDKIENLELITKKLQQEIKLSFMKEYNNLISEKVISLEKLVTETIPGDWGKDSLEGNYTTKVTCIRGTDLPDLKKCDTENAPNRFIIKKNYISKKLQEYDFIVEISGGSPTQSTGRTAFIPKGFENISNNLICTNFCKAIRCKNKENAIYCYLLFDMWYDSGLFFNYEIGTTGLKNFNLNAVLGLDIKYPTNEFLYKLSKEFELLYNKIIDNSQKINKLNELKQLYLKKFFG